jgi:Peptidase A4 family
MTRIALGEGREVRTFDPPPRGFDPLEASPAELERHGFPALPTNPHHLQRYRRLMRELKGRFHYVPPTFRERRFRAGVETSNTWSGGTVFAPPGGSFQWIQGDWAVPYVAAINQNEWEYMSSWIGIDNANPCQVGIMCEVFQSGNNVTTPPPYLWYEWVPEMGQEVTSVSIRPGDSITVLLCTQQGAGSTSATCFFANRTTGAATSFVFFAPNNQVPLVGNSAEWIVERPTLNSQNGPIAPLAFYGGVLFSNCEAVLTDGTIVDSGTGDTLIMKDNASGDVLADATLLSQTYILCLRA